MSIHPTALIDSNASIDPSVVIGPYTVIGPGVTIGMGTIIGPHVTIEQNTIIGNNVSIHTGAILGADPQDRLYDGRETWLEIGEESIIREYAVIARGSTDKTVIGSKVLVMSHTHIAHDCNIGTGAVISNNSTVLDHVTMGDYSMIGANTFVNRNCRTGNLSFIGGGSRVHIDIPPFVIAGDEPLQITAINNVAMQKFGFSEDDIATVQKIYLLWNTLKPDIETAIERFNTEYPENGIVSDIVSFYQSASRGVI
ncbi:MAG: acyl-ACP--UDP-N-acetylglucosamine O-acyltransferase [Fibrobacteres bacterium]|nr:acyl-ACP--UDP-N-acetylglucosamine O-acyltransferase [Fibrobacterota bacterium]